MYKRTLRTGLKIYHPSEICITIKRAKETFQHLKNMSLKYTVVEYRIIMTIVI